jgi:hypothetical protein
MIGQCRMSQGILVSHGALRALFVLCELVKYMRVQLMMERQD